MTLTAPFTAFVPRQASLATVVPQLVDAYPYYDEFDIAQFLEERWGRRVSDADFERIRTFYVRARLQQYLPEGDDD
ncbi:MAG: hypothetical protein WCG80_06410 [Spirochaetales bacterium]